MHAARMRCCDCFLCWCYHCVLDCLMPTCVFFSEGLYYRFQFREHTDTLTFSDIIGLGVSRLRQGSHLRTYKGRVHWRLRDCRYQLSTGSAPVRPTTVMLSHVYPLKDILTAIRAAAIIVKTYNITGENNHSGRDHPEPSRTFCRNSYVTHQLNN